MPRDVLLLSSRGCRLVTVPDPLPPRWLIPVPLKLSVYRADAPPTKIDYPVREYLRVDPDTYLEREDL